MIKYVLTVISMLNLFASALLLLLQFWTVGGIFQPCTYCYDFDINLSSAVTTIKRILDSDKLFVAKDLPHEYGDKYQLAEFMTDAMVGSSANLFFSIVGDASSDIFDAVKNHQLLRFSSSEKCVFINTTTREVTRHGDKVTHEREVESSGFFGSSSKTTKDTRQTTLVSNVTEHFWEYETDYELSIVFRDNKGNEGHFPLFHSSRTIDIVTAYKKSPYESFHSTSPIDVDISWLNGKITKTGVNGFTIDRSSPSCRTPRWNNDIEDALQFASSMYDWCEKVFYYYTKYDVKNVISLPFSLPNDARANIFSPVVPVLNSESGKGNTSHVLQSRDLESLLLEERNSLNNYIENVVNLKYPSSVSDARSLGVLLLNSDMSFIASLWHFGDVTVDYTGGILYIERLMRDQLTNAIGKQIQVSDLMHFMNHFHMNRFFRDEFKVNPFSYAIRKSREHSPEGSVSINHVVGGVSESIPTMAHQSSTPIHMKLQLNPSTTVRFSSDLYVHGWLDHRFSDMKTEPLEMMVEARQFSSFVLMIGRTPDVGTFEPLHAIIVKDKDLLKIPLEIAIVPSLKTFKYAIQSLSPEQQRFATAFRSMQLEHSALFAILIVPIKPQLERVLNLPQNSLTKETQLNQDLMELFIDYQIPSDLLSYSEGATVGTMAEEAGNISSVNVDSSDKLRAVKACVRTMKVCVTLFV